MITAHGVLARAARERLVRHLGGVVEHEQLLRVGLRALVGEVDRLLDLAVDLSVDLLQAVVVSSPAVFSRAASAAIGSCARPSLTTSPSR